MKELCQFEDFKVARCLKPAGFGEETSAQLHHFADASEGGYGTVTYLSSGALCLCNGKVQSCPVEADYDPSYGAYGCHGCRSYGHKVEEEAAVATSRHIFGTDSTSVLKYINNETSTLVENRVSAILKVSRPSQWRFLNTSINPADMAFRGLRVEFSVACKPWWFARNLTRGPRG